MARAPPSRLGVSDASVLNGVLVLLKLSGWIRSEPLLLAASAMAAFALWRFATDGLAPDGRLPVVCALIYAAGVCWPA